MKQVVYNLKRERNRIFNNGGYMAKLTVSLPEDFKKFFAQRSKTYWQEVARDSIVKHIKRLELAESIVSRSQLTNKEAFDIGMKIKRAIAIKYRKV